MRKEILLSGAMIFGTGAPAMAQEAQSPPPIVEQEKKLDVSGFPEAIQKRVNTDVNPRFFEKMEQRSQYDPNKYFTRVEKPDGFSITYFPRGVDSLKGKVGWTHTVTGTLMDDIGGPLNVYLTHDDVWLQLGEDGGVRQRADVVLYNFDEIHEATETYLKIPKRLKDVPWQDFPFRIPYPALSIKRVDDGEEVLRETRFAHTYLVGGIQSGFILNMHEQYEIPKIRE